MGVRVKQIKKLVQSGLLGWPLKVTIGGTTGFDWKQDQWCGRTDLFRNRCRRSLDYDFWLGPGPDQALSPPPRPPDFPWLLGL